MDTQRLPVRGLTVYSLRSSGTERRLRTVVHCRDAEMSIRARVSTPRIASGNATAATLEALSLFSPRRSGCLRPLGRETF